MQTNNPYQTYVEASLFDRNPAGLVVALYEGGIDAIRQAKGCLQRGEIMARSNYIVKATNILVELVASLDREKGGEISNNLLRLYDYMLRRISEAHLKQAKEPLDEVEALLANLLEAWRAVEKETSRNQSIALAQAPVRAPEAIAEFEDSTYGSCVYSAGNSYAPSLSLSF